MKKRGPPKTFPAREAFTTTHEQSERLSRLPNKSAFIRMAIDAAFARPVQQPRVKSIVAQFTAGDLGKTLD